jgi:small-conductance mechanosensitive channel
LKFRFLLSAVSHPARTTACRVSCALLLALAAASLPLRADQLFPTKPKTPAPAKPAAPAPVETTAPKPVPAPPPHAATAPPAAQMIAGNAAARDQAILAHLNAILQYWHTSESPIQKVGEPSDLIYRNQAVDYAAQIASDAFQSALAEAVLMQPFEKAPAANSSSQSQSQRLQAMHAGVIQRIAQLKAEQSALESQIAAAHGARLEALRQQLQQVEGELELQNAMEDALTRLTGIAQSASGTGLEAAVQQLQRSAPDLTNPKSRVVAPTLDNVSAARTAGVTTKAAVLFQLLSAREALDGLIRSNRRLHQQAMALRAPLNDALRATIERGEQLTHSPNPPGDAPAANPAAKTTTKTAAKTAGPGADNVRQTFDELTNTFKGISAASVPLSEEILTLEESQANLNAWRDAVNAEYLTIFRSLLVRVISIAVALLVLFLLGEFSRRAVARYVRDTRRRRQLMVLRRLLIGFLSGIVLIFGFVTQFSSLATFAGFITAGIAVGLQTILLSVAAYFFIIGRYGVRVGDRITVAGVTGDVIEVGLVRFYVLEMASAGSAFHPTGRVAVFSNAVLFQAGTPLYKQMPGTEYAWHQIMVKIDSSKDFQPAVQAMLATVKAVYESYRQLIDRQHRSLESWMDSSIDAPGIQSSLQLMDGGLQFWIRFPVVIRHAAAQDEKMTEALLQVMAGNEAVKAVVTSPPVIQAAVK